MLTMLVLRSSNNGRYIAHPGKGYEFCDSLDDAWKFGGNGIVDFLQRQDPSHVHTLVLIALQHKRTSEFIRDKALAAARVAIRKGGK